jgi:hypothetical protein
VSDSFKTDGGFSAIFLRMKHTLALMALMSVPVFAAAQSGPPPSTVPAQIEAMKACSFLAGQWQGEGWMAFGPGERRSFHQTEDVTFKLNGLLLQIEGLGKNDAGATAHAALAILSYDPDEKRYRFKSYEHMGHTVDAAAECRDGTMTWILPAGPRTIRYTINLNQKGQWYEIGEATTDGKSYQKFFEMTLDRIKRS